MPYSTNDYVCLMTSNLYYSWQKHKFSQTRLFFCVMFHSGIYQNTDFALLIIFKDFKKLDHSLDEQVFCFKNNINRSLLK